MARHAPLDDAVGRAVAPPEVAHPIASGWRSIARSTPRMRRRRAWPPRAREATAWVDGDLRTPMDRHTHGHHRGHAWRAAHALHGARACRGESTHRTSPRRDHATRHDHSHDGSHVETVIHGAPVPRKNLPGPSHQNAGVQPGGIAATPSARPGTRSVRRHGRGRASRASVGRPTRDAHAGNLDACNQERAAMGVPRGLRTAARVPRGLRAAMRIPCGLAPAHPHDSPKPPRSTHRSTDRRAGSHDGRSMSRNATLRDACRVPSRARRSILRRR